MGPAEVICAGVDLGLRHEKDADEFILSVGEGSLLASTHLVDRRVAVAFTGGEELLGRLLAALEGHQQWTLVVGERAWGDQVFLAGAREAVTEHSNRKSGRLVCFPGSAELVGEVSVADILASAIERVAVLADEDAPARTRVVTRDFVRPRWSGGQLVLHTQPNRGGTLVPFETPNPTPCCQDHR